MGRALSAVFSGCSLAKRKQFAGLSWDAKLVRVNAYFRASPLLGKRTKMTKPHWLGDYTQQSCAKTRTPIAFAFACSLV